MHSFKESQFTFPFPSLLLLVAFISCSVHVSVQDKDISWEEMSTLQRLEEIRRDSSYISYLDSCAHEHIGRGAKCIDPVQHLFGCDGRWWLFSDDWGGLLELPEGWIPEEDIIQTELTFHGTDVWSQDSLAVVSMYSGVGLYEDVTLYERDLRSRIESHSIIISSWKKDYITLSETARTLVLSVSGLSGMGERFYGRFIPSGPDGVEYWACVQWKADAMDINSMLGFIDRFPFGPDGQVPDGDAVKYGR